MLSKLYCVFFFENSEKYDAGAHRNKGRECRVTLKYEKKRKEAKRSEKRRKGAKRGEKKRKEDAFKQKEAKRGKKKKRQAKISNVRESNTCYKANATLPKTYN